AGGEQERGPVFEPGPPDVALVMDVAQHRVHRSQPELSDRPEPRQRLVRHRAVEVAFQGEADRERDRAQDEKGQPAPPPLQVDVAGAGDQRGDHHGGHRGAKAKALRRRGRRGFGLRHFKPSCGGTRGSSLVVEQLAQLLARLEIRDALGRHVDLVARLGIAPGPGAAVADPEAAEAAQLDLLARLEGEHDAVEHLVDDDLRLFLGQLRRAGDLFHQLGLGHSVSCEHRRPPVASRWSGGPPERTAAREPDQIYYASWDSAASASASEPPARFASDSSAGLTTPARIAASRVDRPASAALRTESSLSESTSPSVGCETPWSERPTFLSPSSMRRMRARTQSPTA